MLKTPFPSSVFALYLWLSVSIHWTLADLGAVSNVVSFVPIEHPGFPFISTVLRTGFTATRLGCFIFVTLWTEVVFISLCFDFLFFFFVNASHTHSSSLGTFFWGSDVNFYVQFLILFFSGSGIDIRFFLYLLLAIPRWHSMPFTETKTQRVTAEGIVFSFFFHCLAKKQILKTKKKEEKNKPSLRSVVACDYALFLTGHSASCWQL